MSNSLHLEVIGLESFKRSLVCRRTHKEAENLTNRQPRTSQRCDNTQCVRFCAAPCHTFVVSFAEESLPSKYLGGDDVGQRNRGVRDSPQTYAAST
jgi:hypothetical protein